MIAGLRFDKSEKKHALAKFIKKIGNFFISKGWLTPAFSIMSERKYSFFN